MSATPDSTLANPVQLIADLQRQHGIEYGREVAGRGIDDLQDFGGRGLPLQRLVTLGFALAKLTLEIGYPLIGIG